MSITVLGGGISGLTAAYYLSIVRKTTKVNLYEASSRFGGWIKTDINDKEGYIFEAGPRTIRPKGLAGNNTLELIQLLELENKVWPITAHHVAAKNRMIYVKNKLCLMPSDIKGALRINPPFSKPLYYGAIKDFFGWKSKKRLDDESIYSFTSRRFGKEIADYAISSMICGICAGDAKEISVKFLMKNLFEKEQKFGSVLRGIILDFLLNGSERTKSPSFQPTPLYRKAQIERWSIYTLQGGLQTLPKVLENKLEESESVSLNLNSNCKKITFETGGPAKVMINGITHKAEHVISSLPSIQLSQLVSHQHPILSNELKMIKCVDVAVINLHYKKDLLDYQGFGLLVPPMENLPILGIIFDSCCFGMKDRTVLTIMCGGKWFEKWFGKDPNELQLLNVAMENVGKILNIHEKPDNYKVNILKDCIPQYVVGHHQRVERIRKYIEDNKLPLSLCGASYDGVGVNDVILSARLAVEKLMPV
ncbi:CLUMA_CG005168, isoform A [Clunio marinus]|uniref:Protoporphyrinogen oxidase n=1 Tax=Clunio marinus TaxID=568069 RepID=A0A1J1HVC6_9DIPT|nr:CLUMA_CG005168, isoform A [Clunio marinus]